jgi:UDP-3-O-[3-hydroxymyristoyl] glucosamine N-acyltransferase
VGQDLPPNQAYSGSPAIPHREWLRMAMSLPKVPEMRRMLTDIGKRLIKIEENRSLKEEEK